MKKKLLSLLIVLTGIPLATMASEADLVVPDLSMFKTLGTNGWNLLAWGLVIIVLGMLFGLYQFNRIKKYPSHKSMLNVANTIYETCKTYLLQQGKFLIILFAIIGVAIIYYFGFLARPEVTMGEDGMSVFSFVSVILLWTILGILGSYGVAWFGIRINTLANARTSFASLKGKPFQ